MKIYVAGHEGLVGRAITRAIDARPDLDWIGAAHFDRIAKPSESEADIADSMNT